MLTDTVKYWLAVTALMVLMWGYSGKISTALMFGVAAAGAFVYWRLTAQRKKRAIDAARGGQHNGRGPVEERPHGA